DAAAPARRGGGRTAPGGPGGEPLRNLEQFSCQQQLTDFAERFHVLSHRKRVAFPRSWFGLELGRTGRRCQGKKAVKGGCGVGPVAGVPAALPGGGRVPAQGQAPCSDSARVGGWPSATKSWNWAWL